MDIVFSVNNNQEVKVLPIVPNNIEMAQEQKNEEFETMNSGTLTLIGEVGLRTLSIASYFPNQPYHSLKPFSSSDGWSYVDFIDRNRKKRIPFRLVMTDKNGKNIVNMPCTIDSFSYHVMPNGDIAYTLDAKEYRFVGA